MMVEFNSSGFMDYLHSKFPDVFEGTCGGIAQELVDTLIDHASRYENRSRDQLCNFLSGLLPEAGAERLPLLWTIVY